MPSGISNIDNCHLSGFLYALWSPDFGTFFKDSMNGSASDICVDE